MAWIFEKGMAEPEGEPETANRRQVRAGETPERKQKAGNPERDFQEKGMAEPEG